MIGPVVQRTDWAHDPITAVVLLVIVALYLDGATRPGEGEFVRPRTTVRPVAFALGLGIAGLTMLSPLDTLGAQFFAAHMLQHLVLIVVVAPLVAWSHADLILRRAIPVRTRRWLARHLAGSAIQAWTNSPRTAWIAACAFAGTIWLWHIPAAHDSAVRNAALHTLEHFMVLGTATMFWRVILNSGQLRIGPGLAAVIVSLVSLQGSLLSAILMFAPKQLCGSYAGNPIEDQVMAGLLMCIPASFVYLGSTVWALSRLLSEKPTHAG